MLSTSTLGVVFVILGFAAMLLMMHLWGYPYDKATRTSAAPRWAMYLHRVLGYLFAIVYVILMARMVPRLWQYQVEFPARTVVHMVVGFTIGFLLLVKILIMRCFRHFEEWMPYLGTAIMLGTVILLGLSLPFTLHHDALAGRAPGGSAFSAASQARVARLLPMAGMPADAPLPALATAAGLAAGRAVLTDKCVVCHDLKTILDQPRTPAGWYDVVERMGDKPTLFQGLSDAELYQVTAYLVAITPDLQKSRRQRRADALARTAAMTAAAAPAAPLAAPPPAIDPHEARPIYEDKCSQCHDLADVDAAPPTSPEACTALVRRMITENEAELTPREIELIEAYLIAHFVEKKA